jgi:hypothetical protein
MRVADGADAFVTDPDSAAAVEEDVDDMSAHGRRRPFHVEGASKRRRAEVAAKQLADQRLQERLAGAAQHWMGGVQPECDESSEADSDGGMAEEADASTRGQPQREQRDEAHMSGSDDDGGERVADVTQQQQQLRLQQMESAVGTATADGRTAKTTKKTKKKRNRTRKRPRKRPRPPARKGPGPKASRHRRQQSGRRGAALERGGAGSGEGGSVADSKSFRAAGGTRR